MLAPLCRKKPPPLRRHTQLHPAPPKKPPKKKKARFILLLLLLLCFLFNKSKGHVVFGLSPKPGLSKSDHFSSVSILFHLTIWVLLPGLKVITFAPPSHFTTSSTLTTWGFSPPHLSSISPSSLPHFF